jgi:cbb3-type cytochrome oxidase subunit 3
MGPPIHPERHDYSATILVVILMLFMSIIAFGSGIEEKKASAQENSTAVVDDVRTILRDERAQLSELKNMTAHEIAILNEINVVSTKLATQGTYTALSVFFLGVALVIFGLRLANKSITAHLGKYFTVMVWALTIPVMILVSIFQVGIVTNSAVAFHETQEPFFLLSFLMYIPIGIILFLLSEQKKIIRSQAAGLTDQTERNLIQELEKIFTMKEKGMISNEEFQKLKTELLAKL